MNPVTKGERQTITCHASGAADWIATREALGWRLISTRVSGTGWGERPIMAEIEMEYVGHD